MNDETAAGDAAERRVAYRDRLFERLQAQTSKFRNLFFGTIGFAVGFLCLVLVPYAQTERTIERLRHALVEFEAVSTIFVAKTELAEVKKSVDTEFKKYLKIRTKEKIEAAREYYKVTEIGLAGPEDNYNRATWTVFLRFLEYREQIISKILEPVKALVLRKKTKLEHWQSLSGKIDELEASLNSLQKDMLTMLKKEKKLDTKNKVDSVAIKPDSRADIKESSEKYIVSLDDLLKQLDSSLKYSIGSRKEFNRLKTRYDADQLAQADLEAQRRDIAERANALSTPLGPLQLRVTEMILLFPGLIALGFLLASTAFLDAARLRSKFRSAYAETGDPDGTVSDDRELDVLAPLFLHSVPPSKLMMQLGQLLLPLAAAVVALIIIYSTWETSKLEEMGFFGKEGARWILGALGVASFGWGGAQFYRGWKT